mgnify:CR=1 FL=1
MRHVQYLFPFKGPLTEQPFMELFFAFILAAGCSAIFFNMGASSGGTDIIALILKIYEYPDRKSVVDHRFLRCITFIPCIWCNAWNVLNGRFSGKIVLCRFGN